MFYHTYAFFFVLYRAWMFAQPARYAVVLDYYHARFAKEARNPSIETTSQQNL